jgi:serine/threonine protein kinase/tetratricopeptide (TPR) repeat protein
LEAGDVILDRFELQAVAASGGMGSVHRARDRLSDETVAIKLLRNDLTLADRFLREARILAQLTHPGIVRYIAHGKTPSGELFLAMEWLEGETLGRRLVRGLSIADTVQIAKRIAEVLVLTHAQGVVHRDIKPSNIFLVDRDPARVKVLDFGIARTADASRAMTATGMLVGTPGFMAPEQVRGERDVGPRADLFSLGCLVWACLTGKSPFRGDDVLSVLAKVVLEEVPLVNTVRPDVPRELAALVGELLTKEAAGRPTDASAVVAALGALRNLSQESVAVDDVHLRSLTMGEQRVVSLILLDDARSRPEDATMAETTTDNEIRAVADSHGARMISLANGRAILTLSGKGTATDQARQAAACALAVHALVPRRPIALATGRGELASRLPMGQVVDRAATLLRAVAEAAPEMKTLRGVRIDELAAGLLPVDFDVGGDDVGLVLRKRRELGTTRTLLGKPTPCVGRERELGVLRGIYVEVAAESVARVAFVTGAPGVGKSRLRYEFLRELSARVSNDGPEIWTGRGDPVGAGSPFGMLVDALRRAIGLQDGEPSIVGQRKVRARVARHVATEETARVSEFLGELVGVRFDDDGSVQLRAARQNAVLMGDQMRRAWEDFLLAECKVHPVVLVLDDLHWGDLPTVKFVDSALRLFENQPFMVVALGRPEVSDLFPKLWSERAVQPIPLGGLTRRAAEKLVKSILGDALSAETVANVIERAGGNAFYLEELIRAVADGEAGRLPETVLAMVQARLEALEPEARRVLRASSIFGQVFWARGVIALLGERDEVLVRDWLEELVRRELISARTESAFAGEDEYVFRHALVRDAAHAMLTSSDETLGHSLAARWLEKAGERDAMVLAEHYERGGEPSSAVDCYRRAAEQALEGNDFDAALKRADRGCTSGASGPALGALRLIQAEASRWRGDFAAVSEHGLAALDSLEHGSAAWLTAAAEVSVASARLGRREQLLDVTARLATAKMRPNATAARAMAFARAAMQLVVAGSQEKADALLAELAASEASLERDEPFAMGRLYEARAMLAIGRGNPEAYLKLVTAAAAAFERVGDLRMVCNQRTNVGYATRELGDYETAARALQEARAAAERMGLLSLATIAKHNLGPVLAQQGDFEQAAALEREAIESCVLQGDRWMEGGSRIYLADIFALAGRLEDAEREARTAVEVANALPPLRAYAQGTLARVLLRRGSVEPALEAARAAMEQLRALGGIEEGESVVRLAHAETLEAAQDKSAAKIALSEAVCRLRERAAKIEDPRLRESFLRRIPENARTLELGGALE